ncbi:MAG: dihydrofolate reductase family protein [Chryseobacterium sp.]|jgi:dihydrofolate reductase|uniref:dihydrofolate reductase family protein n=1 Tax=Chryseobacterium sp. TaxID=1871047 RepID=UPI00283A0E88|nr:dihydrofolate reductase family protein [Chryseobacterium sp.]MDR2235010.1 dihydrofolate reductase family protein [Chryseobacterium sp.]
MRQKNKVFIATSLDGYIADRNGEIDWLLSIPNPENDDMGYKEFTSGIDALIMGRNTFEVVCGFDEWYYEKHVFVLSSSMTEIPEQFRDKASLVRGNLKDVLAEIHEKGYRNLYIDGGKTIQSFLKEDLIDEMIITLIPYLLGGGVPLFGALSETLEFECTDTKIFLNSIVQNHFVRKR